MLRASRGVSREEPGVATADREAPDAHIRALIVVGTRPEAIKLVPVIHALQRSRRIDPYVVTTGQHADLVGPILDAAAITPDFTLDVGAPGQSINQICARVMDSFEELIVDLRGGGPERRRRPRLTSPYADGPPRFPSFTLVHGDTTSALAAGLASVNSRIPVFHLEAGLRSGDLHSPFPEELNRVLLSRLSAFHLSPTLANKEILVREGVDAATVYVTGNTGLDALRWAAGLRAPWDDPRLEGIDDGRPVIVVTAHRRENWGMGLQGIAQGVADLARARPEMTVVVPLHPNPRVRADLTPALADLPNVVLTEPIDYIAFARLLAAATLAITDSGGIQEEGPSVGTPVLVARDTTEREEGIAAGTLRLVGTDPVTIRDEALRLLDDPNEYAAMTSAVNPFGDGHAADRIVHAFEYLAGWRRAPEPYGSDFTREAVFASAGYETIEIAEDLEEDSADAAGSSTGEGRA